MVVRLVTIRAVGKLREEKVERPICFGTANMGMSPVGTAKVVRSREEVKQIIKARDGIIGLNSASKGESSCGNVRKKGNTEENRYCHK